VPCADALALLGCVRRVFARRRGGGGSMPYRTRATPCVVRLLPLRSLWAAILAQCAALRAEAAGPEPAALEPDQLAPETPSGFGPDAAPLARGQRDGAGDQGWPLCPPPPHRPGALPAVPRELLPPDRAAPT